MIPTVTIPTDAAGLEETLADDARLKAILEGGGLGEFVKNYADAHHKANPDVTEQVRDAATAALKAFLDDGSGNEIEMKWSVIVFLAFSTAALIYAITERLADHK